MLHRNSEKRYLPTAQADYLLQDYPKATSLVVPQQHPRVTTVRVFVKQLTRVFLSKGSEHHQHAENAHMQRQVSTLA